jgi:hypothetical protein
MNIPKTIMNRANVGGKQSPHGTCVTKKSPLTKSVSKTVSFDIDNNQSSDDSMSTNEDIELAESEENDIVMVGIVCGILL